AADLIGTVVGAIPRADAPVVDHIVKAFAAVYGRTHRANHLAGRLLALHARDRFKEGLGVLAIPLVVGVHAEPVHVTSAIGLLLADYRDIVLRLASDNAVVASHACVQVDRHAPGEWLLAVLETGNRWIQSELLFR